MMKPYCLAFDYDFNNPRGTFNITKDKGRPQVGEEIFLYATDDDGEGFGCIVEVTQETELGDCFVYHTDYPERTWRKE